MPSRAEVPHAELSLILTSAILTFSASERLGFSGIAALFAFGVLTRHYTFHNLSPQAQSASTTLFLTLATLCETSLSTLLGVAAFDYVVWFGVDREADSMLYTNGGAHALAVVTLPVLFIARACNIFPLTALANCLRRGRGRGGRKQRISWQMQVVMWFSGMRGALSFALVVTLSERRSPHLTLPLPIYHQLVSATLVTIVVTTLLMAPATRPLVRSLRLGVDGTTEQGKELAAALLTGTGGDEGEGYGGGGGGRPRGRGGREGSRRGGRHRGGRDGGVEAARRRSSRSAVSRAAGRQTPGRRRRLSSPSDGGACTVAVPGGALRGVGDGGGGGREVGGSRVTAEWGGAGGCHN